MSARRVLAGSAIALLMPASLLGWSETSSATATADTAASAASVRTAVRQSVTLKALPQIVQQGGRVGSANAAKAAITATVKPVKVGRKVRLQVRSGSSWRTVSTVRTDQQGRAHFAARASSGGQGLAYRAQALKFQGLKALRSKPVSTAQWVTPTWTDEFSGSALSPAWNHRAQVYSRPSMRACSKGHPSAVRVGGGAVRLSVIKDRNRSTKCKARVNGKVAGKFAYRLNGHIGTEGAFSFRYGVAAARVKFHRRLGQHGSFWMQPVGGMYQGGKGHEIDVIEYFGDNHPRGGLTTFVHRYQGSRVVKTGSKRTNYDAFLKNKRDGWSKNYHVFSVEWAPRKLVFYIDGKEHWRITGRISSAQQYPILSLLSSDYEIPRIKDSQLPQHMYVDWVRVWETGPGA